MTEVSPYLVQPLDRGYREEIERWIATFEDELRAADNEPRRREIRSRLRLLRLELRLAP